MASKSNTVSRTFVLGLDGVPWNLITEWTADGKLPNFTRLANEGASGPLRSTNPATTPLAWPSIATGGRPDKHGIYGWRSLTSEYTHRMYTDEDVDLPFLWDVLSPAVVANVPMTYPAREIDGSMVTGMMTPKIGDGFTYPPKLTRTIEEKIPDYQIGLRWGEYEGRTAAFLRDLHSLVESRRQLMRLLMDHEEWRLFFFVYTAPDRLQHLVWDEDVLLDHYRYLDSILGEVMDYVDAHDANLFVVSDHGFGPVDKRVAVNSVLESEGWLERRRESGVRGTLEQVGLTRDAVTDVLERVGVDEGTLLDRLPRWVVDSVASQFPGDHVLYDVNFSETVAFLHGPGNVYVNDTERFAKGTVEPGDVEEVKQRIAKRLTAVTDPETGRQVLDISDGDDEFPTDSDSPDLVVEGRDGYKVVKAFTSGPPVSPAITMEADHRSEGIFFAWGPNVEPGATVEDATVYDVAPTILHGTGEAIPAGADGEVLIDVFDHSSAASRVSMEAGQYGPGTAVDQTTDDLDDVEERLRGLGYMD